MAELQIVDGVACVGDLVDQCFDARPYQGLLLCGTRYVNARVSGVRGVLQIGGSMDLIKFAGCAFCDVQVSRLSLGIADYEDCRFDAIRISHLVSHSASLYRCAFSGVIRRAIVKASIKHSMRQPPMRAEWRAIDFSRCSLGDVEFRDGILMGDWKFAETERQRLVLNIFDFERLFANSQLSPGQRDIARRIVSYSEEIDQVDYLVPMPFAKQWGNDFEQLMRMWQLASDAKH